MWPQMSSYTKHKKSSQKTLHNSARIAFYSGISSEQHSPLFSTQTWIAVTSPQQHGDVKFATCATAVNDLLRYVLGLGYFGLSGLGCKQFEHRSHHQTEFYPDVHTDLSIQLILAMEQVTQKVPTTQGSPTCRGRRPFRWCRLRRGTDWSCRGCRSGTCRSADHAQSAECAGVANRARAGVLTMQRVPYVQGVPTVHTQGCRPCWGCPPCR